MLKKSLYVGGAGVIAVALFSFLLFGRQSWSYVTTAFQELRQSAKDSVPIKFEIERARQMIKDLEPQIHKSETAIAKEEVEVDSLSKAMNKGKSELAKDESDIMRLKADLERGDTTFVYYTKSGDTKRFSAKDVRDDLTSRFERFKTKESTSEKQSQILAARERGLNAAREKLTAMRNAKRELEVQVENLKARLEMVEVAKTSSELNIDDSQLSRTRELIRDINARLDVQDKLLNSDSKSHDEIQLDKPVGGKDEDITKQVTEYFAKSRPESVATAEK